MMVTWRRAGCILGLVGILLAGLLIGFAYQAETSSLEAEKTLHAYLVSLDLLTVYVRKNPGKWPTSWDDLIGVSPSTQSPIYHWPEDSGEFSRRVQIDFGLTRAQIAAQNEDNFSAVIQVGPNYGPEEPRIKMLLEAARR